MMTIKKLRDKLDPMLTEFSDYSYVENDPLGQVREFAGNPGREVAAYVSAGFAFGNIKSILSHLRKIWEITGPDIAAFTMNYTHSNMSPFGGIRYRWITPAATSALFHVLGEILKTGGSIENFFNISPDVKLVEKLGSFSHRALALAPPSLGEADRRGLAYFFTSPDTGSACKRLNLFLRWVVRKAPPDLGIWSSPCPSELMIPLDVHVARVARQLGLTSRKTRDIKMAWEITEVLRKLNPQDPLIYDFALHKSGIAGGKKPV